MSSAASSSRTSPRRASAASADRRTPPGRRTPPAGRRSPFGRRTPQEGPRASFRQLLPFLLEHRTALVVALVLSLVSAGMSLLQPVLVSRVIADVQSGAGLGGLVWALVALVAVGGVISGVQHYVLQRAGTSVVYSARRRLVTRMLHLPIVEYDTRRTGDLVSRVGSDTTLLYAVMTQGLTDALGSVVLFVGALVAMLILDPVLLGLTVLVIAITVAVVLVLSGRVRRASAEQQARVGDLASSVERALGAIRTVRAANATDREVASIDADAERAFRAGVKVASASAVIVPLSFIAMQVSFLVVLGVGGYRVASGAITIASLVAFILFLFMMIMPLGQAIGALNSVNQALGAVGRIQEIIELPSETEGDAAAQPTIETPATGPTDAAIAFDDVAFAYPVPAGADAAGAELSRSERAAMLRELGAEAGSEGPPEVVPAGQRDDGVLHGVSFTVPRGQRVALVGPSGAGKSTILALIERFYDPTAGAVRLGGIDIRSIPRDELRAQIGYVEQDAPVLAGTIRDNLLLSAPQATDEQCLAVLAAVNLTGVVSRSGLGLDAQVGEDGIMLSGGERQRLAIARTLLAAPPILLLDESTSSLDGVNEQLMREAIDAVASDRTLLVIAHRLSTVVDSDRIVVLEAGRVVGVGTHSELVRSTPLYAELAKHQLLV
ncbi:ABC transporter ATP-binding protein [Galbitalea sp. SE-J8]|uniref:ABC transporter ATP-binding protein n=1 Tax=Galbitalea sp. SE-J8 TaxID=3054952 RepID=UPI00259C78C4|nr:ABC transporter ATP-binding protein [Galbitalea sp. SE-J8]MDM4763618.1 ABC transporter ATP-binding protein [Galbitalea sp. SE-J8]